MIRFVGVEEPIFQFVRVILKHVGYGYLRDGAREQRGVGRDGEGHVRRCARKVKRERARVDPLRGGAHHGAALRQHERAQRARHQALHARAGHVRREDSQRHEGVREPRPVAVRQVDHRRRDNGAVLVRNHRQEAEVDEAEGALARHGVAGEHHEVARVGVPKLEHENLGANVCERADVLRFARVKLDAVHPLANHHAAGAQAGYDGGDVDALAVGEHVLAEVRLALCFELEV
eukprot:1188818-Prorocentrum_minimum.AAC.5